MGVRSVKWTNTANFCRVGKGSTIRDLGYRCQKIVDVFTLVTSSMELSCFSSLALTPSAWLTGEEDEEEVTVLFSKVSRLQYDQRWKD